MIFRVCPKCWAGWEQQPGWLVSTKPIGREIRKVEHPPINGCHWHLVDTIEVELREHIGCGGVMCDQGEFRKAEQEWDNPGEQPRTGKRARRAA